MAGTSGEAKGIRKILAVFGPLAFGITYLRDRKWILSAVVISSVIATLFRLLVPIYVGDAVTSIQNVQYPMVEYYVLLIFFVSSVSAGVQFIVNYGSQYLSQSYAYNLRKDLFSHLVRKRSRL